MVSAGRLLKVAVYQSLPKTKTDLLRGAKVQLFIRNRKP